MRKRSKDSPQYYIVEKPTYGVWSSMIQRCNNPNCYDYKYYGAKGITVTEYWLKFENFFKDMGSQPPNKTLDRIKGKLGYYKENCRWATWLIQGRNRESVRKFTFNGKTLYLSEWADEFKIKYGTLDGRLRKGWSIEKALTFPVKTRGKRKSLIITYNGKIQTIKEWANELNLNYDMLKARLIDYGWTIEKSFNTKSRKRNILFDFEGKTLTLKQWAAELNMSYELLHQRIKVGWSIKEALTTPVNDLSRRFTKFYTFNGKIKHLDDWEKELGINKSTLISRLGRGWSVEKAFTLSLKKNAYG